MPDTRRLWHYTANTGDVAETGRDECHQAALDLLLPIVDAQEGDLPELGLGIDIMTPRDAQRPRLPGAAFFQIGPAGERMSKAPYVMGVACWRANRPRPSPGQACMGLSIVKCNRRGDLLFSHRRFALTLR